MKFGWVLVDLIPQMSVGTQAGQAPDQGGRGNRGGSWPGAITQVRPTRAAGGLKRRLSSRDRPLIFGGCPLKLPTDGCQSAHSHRQTGKAEIATRPANKTAQWATSNFGYLHSPIHTPSQRSDIGWLLADEDDADTLRRASSRLSASLLRIRLPSLWPAGCLLLC